MENERMTRMKDSLELLKSTTCKCGGFKKAKQAFCYNCFKLFPAKIQQDLYKRIGDGFEGAVDDALKFLKERRGII